MYFRQIMKQTRLLFLAALITTLSFSLKTNAIPVSRPDTLAAMKGRWVDSIYTSLDSNQRIAQLLFIRAFSTRDQAYTDSLTRVVASLNVGGICFFKGAPVAQVELTNCWQERVKTPLMISIDAEWGMGMRIDSAFSFPYQMTLGAIRDDSLIYRMSSQIAMDCRRMGIHMNLAPVADINNNPENPVINLRSFGENPQDVLRKSIFYMKGLQDHGILSTGKHFPGHGDTDTDSHLSLPVIGHSAARLDSVELVPFRGLIHAGMGGIMIAHLYVPAYETIPGLPATLSHSFITGLLKEKMGFRGFVITDALDMKGVTNGFRPGELEVKALQAGNDILLLPKDAHKAVAAIRQAADSGILSWQMLESKCKAILNMKYDLGLAHYRPVNPEHLTSDLNPHSSSLLNETLFRESVTIVKNDNLLLPLSLLDHHKIACVAIGDTATTSFSKRLSLYFPFDNFILGPKTGKHLTDSIMTVLQGYDLVVMSIHRANLYPKNHFGISDTLLTILDSVSHRQRAILALFGNPYILRILKNPDDFEAIVTTYQDRPDAEEIAAEVIAGGTGAEGKLPVTTAKFVAGTGIATSAVRLGFTPPETFGLTDVLLKQTDSLALDGIRSGAYPGCEVLLAKDGKIFYHKAFGNPMKGDSVEVNPSDIYDLASVTKMAGTTLAIMKLYEEGRINLDTHLRNYLPLVRNTPKGKLTIREIMTHQAGLQAWIPFYLSTISNGRPDTTIYASSPSADFPVRVAENMYIKDGYRDDIFRQIIHSETGKRGEYKYSDLGFYLLAAMVEHLTGETLDAYLDREFYKPLGLTTMGYKPLLRFPASRIMPTEDDTVWRKQLLRGDVHDPGAAMLGGVAGHAGLFSDAFDLAVIMQMLLNYGEYGGKQYLMPSTVKEFTRAQYPETKNRRGLGFDRPLPAPVPDGPSCPSASQLSFGHSGFTGTYVWADPENNLIYVFLSNRVCPDASNTTLSEKNIRTNLHQSVYDLLNKVQGK